MDWSEVRTTAARALATIVELHVINPAARLNLRFALGTPEVPEPEEASDEAPRHPLHALLEGLGGGAVAGIPVFQVGTDGPCDACGENHGNEPMVMVPLPDGSFVVSHKDRDKDSGECTWAEHTQTPDQAHSAARLHEEFQCVRRHATH